MLGVSRSKKIIMVACSLSICVVILCSGLWCSSGVRQYRTGQSPHAVFPPLNQLNTTLEEYMEPIRAQLVTNKYTVLMPTYRRNDLLPLTLRFHCTCRHVDRIIVVWNNVHEDVPRKLTQFPCKVDIIFVRQQRNSLNNRFKPYSQIRTESVLVIDDDRLEQYADIELAYETWKSHKHMIVGFQSYIHEYNATSKLYYLENRPQYRPLIEKGRTTYSIILTTGFFINVFYLNLYTTYIPEAIKQFVDNKFNGEDIVMNFMVAEHVNHETQTEQPSCLWVQSKATHLEWSARRFRGLNHVVKSFLKERDELLNLLVKEYGRMTLQRTNTVIRH